MQHCPCYSSMQNCLFVLVMICKWNMVFSLHTSNCEYIHGNFIFRKSICMGQFVPKCGKIISNRNLRNGKWHIILIVNNVEYIWSKIHPHKNLPVYPHWLNISQKAACLCFLQTLQTGQYHLVAFSCCKLMIPQSWINCSLVRLRSLRKGFSQFLNQCVITGVHLLKTSGVMLINRNLF